MAVGAGVAVGRALGLTVGVADGATVGIVLACGEADAFGDALGPGVAGTGVEALVERPYSATQTEPLAGILKPKRPVAATVAEVAVAAIVPGPP